MENLAAMDRLQRSRQKNCNGCVTAKRRCDRRTPVCSRCVEKMIPCSYGKPAASASSSSSHSGGRPLSFHAVQQPNQGHPEQATLPAESLAYTNSTQVQYPLAMEERSADMGFHISMMPMDFHVDVAAANSAVGIDPTPPYVTGAPLPLDTHMGPFTNLTDHTIGHDQGPWLLPLDDEPVEEIPSEIPPEDRLSEEVAKTYEKMAFFDEDMEPWRMHDPKSVLHYLTHRNKAFVTDIATRNATPFLHRSLYRNYTPPCIASLFSTAVLYANRTPDNTTMVIRALSNVVKELIENESGRMVATPIDRLARCQAMYIYFIIRVLDGDVILRAQGERDIPLLMDWLLDLAKVRENMGDLAQLGNSVMKQPPAEWERWIFAESVRRTIVLAHSFLKLYEQMKASAQNGHKGGVWNNAQRWTLSKHLWDADSAYAFARAWKEKPHFIITNYSFDHFLKNGRGEDVDEFAEILLSVYMGVEAMKEFTSGKDYRQLITG